MTEPRDAAPLEAELIVDQVSTKDLLAQNSTQLVRDIIGPIRVILAQVIVFSVFLMASQALFWVFDFTLADLRARIEFVGWMLDGVQILSGLAVSIYFVGQTILSLKAQWRIASILERRQNPDDRE